MIARLYILLLALAGLLTAPLAAAAPPRDWTLVAQPTAAGGMLVGNPAARVKLVEYVSYTCPHCAAFTVAAAPVLKGQMVRSGSTSVEVRPAVREALDLAATMLARCAGPARFSATSDALFAHQREWYERGADFNNTNGARLGMYPVLDRLKMIAQGAGLTDLVAAQGVPRAAVDGCFTTDADLNRITAATQASWAKIAGTPAFELNGRLLDRHTEWAQLEPMLRAAGAR